jgi:signal transduction histidine kinase
MLRARWPGWWQTLRRSLGLRLMLMFAVLALLLVAIFLGGMQRVFSSGYGDLFKPLLADYVDRLALEVGSPPDVARARALEERLNLAIHIDGPLVQYGAAPSWRHDHGERQEGGGWLLARRSADGHRISFRLQENAWPQRARGIGWVTLALLLTVTALAYLWVRRLIRPIDDIRAGTIRFAKGDFGTPIKQRRPDELGELAAQVNHMASSLQAMLDAKRALLLAISHELRSPLTRARLNAELVNDGPERSALLRDLAEMRDLITNLLEQERLAAGHDALHAQPGDINALVRSLCAEVFAAAAITLELDETLPLLNIDATRVRMALRNLIDNALRHGAAQRPCLVRSAQEGGRLMLSVRDFGPGVSDEQLQHLAEPFYRTDASRGRDSGGVGLGLTLCRLVAQAHGGELRLARENPGLRATLVLPLGT